MAIAGPIIIGSDSADCSSATPLPTNRSGTMSLMYARRVGPVNANDDPSRKLVTTSQMIAICPVTIRIASSRKANAITLCASTNSRRFGSRSASAPASGPITSHAIPFPAPTKPTAAFSPVRSNATTLCTVNDIENAMNAATVCAQCSR